MKNGHRRSFSPEFKLEAVSLVTESGRPLSQVAREPELRPEQLRHWKKQLQASGQVARSQAVLSAEEEVRRLRREIEVLRQERDFAKKAAAFFAKDLRGGTLMIAPRGAARSGGSWYLLTRRLDRSAARLQVRDRWRKK
jgi:transposase